MPIGPKLKAIRELRGWNQGTTAEKADINQAHLNQIERGEIPNPHIKTIQKIFGSLGVNSDGVPCFSVNGTVDCSDNPVLSRTSVPVNYPGWAGDLKRPDGMVHFADSAEQTRKPWHQASNQGTKLERSINRSDSCLQSSTSLIDKVKADPRSNLKAVDYGQTKRRGISRNSRIGIPSQR